MSYDLIFLLEEPSTKTVLETILPKLIPEDIRYKCIDHQGKQDLQNSIPKTIKGFSFSPSTKFVIVHDQDSHDCKKLKAELRQLCQSARSPKVIIRIICHELESWFLGDLAAVEKAYSLNAPSLSKNQTKNKFRNPDRLNSAKEELKKLVPEYYPGTHSRAIAPHLSLTANTSHSFHVFLNGINQILS
ncbi:DUF4276 family protein [Leptolyngbya sp. BC1307]|uniref:DUF4276 family protein n=1 Tax=Leptolyngbya sp. BC1307 TaxID=2029589 RepID=UPI000EFB4C00|nr:DUF4276 family protein [Leptolyngbya sp. BC1307]